MHPSGAWLQLRMTVGPERFSFKINTIDVGHNDCSLHTGDSRMKALRRVQQFEAVVPS